jgi:hypothetical protein
MEVLNQFRQYIQDVDNLKVLKPSVTIATQLISFVNHILQNKHYYQNNNITLTEYEEQILLAVVNYITGSDESNCNKLTVPIKLDMIEPLPKPKLIKIKNDYFNHFKPHEIVYRFESDNESANESDDESANESDDESANELANESDNSNKNTILDNLNLKKSTFPDISSNIPFGLIATKHNKTIFTVTQLITEIMSVEYATKLQDYANICHKLPFQYIFSFVNPNEVTFETVDEINWMLELHPTFKTTLHHLIQSLQDKYEVATYILKLQHFKTSNLLRNKKIRLILHHISDDLQELWADHPEFVNQLFKSIDGACGYVLTMLDEYDEWFWSFKTSVWTEADFNSMILKYISEINNPILHDYLDVTEIKKFLKKVYVIRPWLKSAKKLCNH